jgi:RNA polymerase primary sigma factor
MVAMQREPGRGSERTDAYWRDIDSYGLLGHDEEVKLARRSRHGDAVARERLVTANLRFVVRVAREYAGRGLTLMELVSEGNLGLLSAVDRFDETRGFKFITYAVWWIRQAILKALAQAGRVRRAPISRINDLRQLEREAQQLSQYLGRGPTHDEVLAASILRPSRVRNALSEARADVSLDAPLFDGEGRAWDEVLADQSAAPDRQLTGTELDEMVERCLGSLDARARLVVCSYYGLGGYSPMTLAQIGDLVGVTRERVRQLRDGALARMRSILGPALPEFSRN